jgi:hypothetical protein
LQVRWGSPCDGERITLAGQQIETRADLISLGRESRQQTIYSKRSPGERLLQATFEAMPWALYSQTIGGLLMRTRITLVAAFATLALGAIAVPAASAATGTNGSANAQNVPPLYKTHAVGVSKNGKKFSGTYGIQRFVVTTVNGKRGVYSLGTLTGTLNGRHVSRNNVMLPAKLTAANTSAKDAKRSTTRATNCPVLHLVLGPINLNLLGLVVTVGGGTIPSGTPATQPITVNIDAQQGGGLLGNLLCGVTNALSGNGVLSQLATQFSALSSILNSIVGLLGGL